MVIESDENSYPGFGYHQQNYTAQQNGYYLAESEEDSYPKFGNNQHNYPTRQNGTYYPTNSDENKYYSTNDYYKTPSQQQYHHANSHDMLPVAACAQPQPCWHSTNSGQYLSMHDSNGNILQYNRDSASKFCAVERFGGHLANGKYGTNNYGTRERINHEYSKWGGDSREDMYQNSGGGYNGYQQKAEWTYT